ncbi:hypothetical protein DFH29DRAFT_814100, partial [Suillus ampliporus]
GFVLCTCGPTGRVTNSIQWLEKMVNYDIFDFVLAFSGTSMIDAIVVPALSRFIENVFVYGLKPWDALEHLFGEDHHALEASPIVLCFADVTSTGSSHEHVVESHMLVYSSFANSRPWGLDMYSCHKCGGPSQNIKFNACRKKCYGNKWLQTKMKYICRQCKHSKNDIEALGWVHSCRADNMYCVWYNWPLTHQQLMDIGVKH